MTTATDEPRADVPASAARGSRLAPNHYAAAFALAALAFLALVRRSASLRELLD